MISAISHAASGSSGSGDSQGTAVASDPVTKNMFLQLLVAQLKNQDPSSPADSTAFVTQLAQFQTMEQSLHQGDDIAAIRQDLDKISSALIAQSKQSS